MKFSSSKLRRWRRLALIRERDLVTGRPLCQLCGGAFPMYAVQAHHVYPKALYPELAYLLSNAAIVCTGCHYQTIHGGNATIDLNRLDHWKEFIVFFRRQNKLSARRTFNEQNQKRL